MAEIVDIVAGISVVLAVIIAIYSGSLRDTFGEAILFLVEVSLLVIIIAMAVLGQSISKS